MIKNGKKISSNMDNPFDIILIKLCNKLINFCYNNNITPNSITIFRLILLFFIIYYLFNTTNTQYIIIGILIFYFLDCLDGHLARSTNQVTILGDYLDHGTDFLFIIVIFIFVLIKKYPLKLQIILILIILFYLMIIHIGLQQKNYKINKKKELGLNYVEHFETLDNLNNLHTLESYHILWTKYFGCGTIILYICLIIIWIKYNEL